MCLCNNVNKMSEWCRIFGLLLRKNFIVRLMHWKVTLFIQILLPIVLFALMQALRDLNSDPPLVITTDTYYPLKSEDQLLDNVKRSFIKIYFVPNDPSTEEFMKSTAWCLQHTEKFVGFATEEDMLDAYTINQIQNRFDDVLAIVIDKNEEGKKFKYKIRHSTRIPSQLYTDMSYLNIEHSYLEQIPFVQLQMCIDRTFINKTTNSFQPKIFIQRMPYPPYIKTNENDKVLRQIILVFAVAIFLMPLCVEINYTAREKFIGVNTLMAMNGVKLYQNLLSWLTTGCIFSIFYIIPLIVLFKNTFSNHVNPYLYYSDAFLFWILMTIHIIHLISFGMHVAAYFAKPVFVIIILSVIYSASSSLYENLVKENMFNSIPYLGIFLPNLLLSRLLEEVNTYETQLIGIRWSNIFIPSESSQYNITGSTGFIFIFSILGTIFHFLMAVYINNLRPGKYGVKKHPLYFLQCIRKNKVSLDEEAEDYDYEELSGEDFEAVSKGVLTPGIQIRGLKKVYNTGLLRKSLVHALKGVSIDFYKGQITALLGHNGAGKTTLMSIITGVTAETEGKIFINGKNLKNHLSEIRNDLGLCPQENIVFPDLNVFQQIEFFGLLKNKHKTRVEIKRNVENLLAKLKLSEKRNCLPTKLSGGQKRRVCLGMALIGDASTFILDEPTSGMDPETRRDTWEMLLKMRGKKTIIISTHNMEEADILGDRIAIVHGGLLRSYGTSMFLKKQYGHGFVEVTLSIKSWCNPEKVVNKFDLGTQINIENDKIILSVPYTENLPDSLDQIEREKKTLGVTGINVSLITLEQVFLKIIKKDESENDLSDLSTPVQKLQGNQLIIQRCLALFNKKYIYATKNLGILFIILFLPLVSIFFMVLSYKNPSESLEITPLTLNMYRNPKAFYSSDNSDYGNGYKEIIEKFWGTAINVATGSIFKELLSFGRKDIADYHNHVVVSAEFNSTNNSEITANGLYSGTMMHSLPLTMNILSNTILRNATGDNKYSIEISKQQLPNSISSYEMEPLSRVLTLCSFLFPTLALFVIHPLQETSTKVKQLQRMTGVTSVSYWLTMFLFDFLICIISSLFITLGFCIMDIILDIRLYRQTEILLTILLLVIVGLNCIFISYIFSFLNKSRSTVITILSITPIGIVFIQYLVFTILQDYETMQMILQRLFFLIPYISFFHGELLFLTVAVKNANCRRLSSKILQQQCKNGIYTPCCNMDCVDGVCNKPMPYIGNFEKAFQLEETILYLFLTPVIYFAILIMLEERIFVRLFNKLLSKIRKSSSAMGWMTLQMDEEVKKEKHAVALEISKITSQSKRNSVHYNANGNSVVGYSQIPESENSLFLVYELSKSYGKLMAVKEVNFRVKKHECFGLLGVNGAGKSTTFRMLTGEETPNSGTMYLKQAEIYSNRQAYLAEMGYCPQTDALINSLNSFDHLRLFARLRGIPPNKIDLEVNKWIVRLNLKACAVQPSGTYSGGNKRRLNIAMALIGSPTLVLLDEPTTGVDPAARRSLWTVIQSCQAVGQSFILTSHSMEECEALCNRLVIMVQGQLVCIGASQELKQRFGAGFDILIKLNPNRSEEDVTIIKNTIESLLTCEIRDENLGFIAYHVTDPTTTWTKMYSTMNDLKNRFECIEDYSVLSATLEQLFIQFARGITMPNYDNSPRESSSQPNNE
ncbi:PREDICTED: ATP-binding cassette sub-family A member 1-like [Polistes dominula]|uniref:ATP-binding cassette sub-family A member 1-like n=1 Tax=Polistes dominula TaxID=743375 RepID=A0ABM1IE70_POLDO|nr:PREDICTED: ATP-binding cassette sub-family A member 1-like [Polistes dominula]XP_015178505.1 PREDICTED: ATP-binding cassette sub-family A member 1-like [Polistes dominula]XP_015178506.1 PREDICTED: ATP-binding cassette sub-family A member 1-like [Polistes dominula]XP_015178507.1 PREDICTED: ATP-binding cassette sub-family A member 1-like [Polistes dominula]